MSEVRMLVVDLVNLIMLNQAPLRSIQYLVIEIGPIIRLFPRLNLLKITRAAL